MKFKVKKHLEEVSSVIFTEYTVVCCSARDIEQLWRDLETIVGRISEKASVEKIVVFGNEYGNKELEQPGEDWIYSLKELREKADCFAKDNRRNGKIETCVGDDCVLVNYRMVLKEYGYIHMWFLSTGNGADVIADAIVGEDDKVVYP